MQSLARNCNVNGSRRPHRDLVIATLIATELSKNHCTNDPGLSEARLAIGFFLHVGGRLPEKGSPAFLD
jgi:hypothetical protein